jgi:hypothetical protein
MNRFCGSHILGICSPYALHMYGLHGLGRFGLVPSLRGGLGSGLRVWVSPGGLGGGESPPHRDILSVKALRVRASIY